MSISPPPPTKVDHPYPGLRPFLREEAEIFFGRGAQVVRMLTCLEDNFFLAVVGSSGSGKSSLVRAGLLPELSKGNLLGTGKDWLFITMKPGEDPYKSLATEWVNEVATDMYTTEKEKDKKIAITQASLRATPDGLIDVLSEKSIKEGTSILLLVDQFEEIFRFQSHNRGSTAAQPTSSPNRNDALAFVNLLLKSFEESKEKRTKFKIYIVITMRSDFIGNCECFPDLLQAISDSQFLVPVMTRDQVQEAIEKPLQLFNWQAEPALVNEILNDIGCQSVPDPLHTGEQLQLATAEQLPVSTADQLPLMQHALMRTWFETQKRKDHQGILARKDYQSVEVGGMANALSRHLDKAWASLEELHHSTRKSTESLQIVAQSLFVSLCERNNEGQLIRRPIPLADVAAVVDIDPGTVMEIVRHFQKDQRNFIVTSPAGQLTKASVLDISHEALLRHWKKLRGWFSSELKSAEIYKLLLGGADQRKKDPHYVLHGLDLHDAEKWKKNLLTPTQAWANRYETNTEASQFNRVLELITASEKERERKKQEEIVSRQNKERELEEEKNRQRQAKRRNLAFAIIASLLAFWSFSSAYKGTKAQERLFVSNAKSAARVDPTTAATYILAALEIQPRLPNTTPTISTVARDILSIAITSPRSIPFQTSKVSLPNLKVQPFAEQGSLWSLLLQRRDRNLYIVTGGADGSIKYWTEDGNLFTTTDKISSGGKRRSPILNLIQLSNGDLISGESDGSLRRWTLNRSSSKFSLQQIWASENDPLIADNKPTRGAIISLASLNPKMFVTGDSNGIITLWHEHKSGFKPKEGIPSGQISVNTLVKISDKEFYSAGQDGSIKRWKIDQPISLIETVIDTKKPLRGLIRMSDNEIITADVFGSIRLLDVRSKLTLDGAINTDQGSIRSVAKLNEDKFLTTGTDGTFIIWHKTMQRLSEPMESGQGVLLNLAAANHGQRLYTSGSDGSVRDWDLSSIEGMLKTTIENQEHNISHSILLGSGNVLTGDQQGFLRWWDHRNGKPMKKTITTGQGKISYIKELNNKAIITAGEKGTIALWNSEGNPIQAPFDADQGKILSVLQRKNGDVVTVSEAGSLREWDQNLKPKGGSPIATGLQSISSAIILQNGEILLGGHAKLFLRRANGTLQELTAHEIPPKQPVGQDSSRDSANQQTKDPPIVSLLELRNGDLLAGDANGNLLQIRKGLFGQYQSPTSYSLSTGGLTGILENENGELLIGSSNGSIYLLEGNNVNTMVDTIKPRLGSVSFLLQSSEGTLIAGWKEGVTLTIRRWPAQRDLLKNACDMVGTPSFVDSPLPGSPATWDQRITTKSKDQVTRKRDGVTEVEDETSKELDRVKNLALNFCKSL